jgi:adenylate cyclase
MSETRKIAAILVADVVGYSRLAGADEDRTLARLPALRSDLIDPTIALHHGRIVKRTGDGSLIEFSQRSRRCALLMWNLYSLTKGQPAIRDLFAAKHDRTANFLLFPSIF